MKQMVAQMRFLFNRKQKRQILGLFVYMLVSSILEVMGVSFVVPLMTAILRPEFVEQNAWIASFCRVAGIPGHKAFVLWCIVLLIGIYIMKNLFLFWQNKKQSYFLMDCNYEMQMRLVDLYLNRSYEFYLTENTNNIVQILCSDLGRTFDLLGSALRMLTEIVISWFVIVAILLINPQMTLCAVLTLGIVMFIVYRWIKPRVNMLGREGVERFIARNSWIMQGLRGIKEVKSLHSEEYMLGEISRQAQAIRRVDKKRAVLGSVPRLLIETACVCTLLAYLAIMLLFDADSDTLIPAMGAFAMAAIRLMPAANRIVAALSNISYNRHSLERVVDALQQGEANREGDYGVLPIRNTGSEGEEQAAICVRDLSYSYPGSQKKVLDNVSMTIPVGGMTCIIGESGAGKTTLVDLILGLLRCQEGEIYIRQKGRAGACRIGYIPQASFMLDDTIRANIAFGIPARFTDEEKIWDCLQRAELEPFVRSLPEQLDTKIGEQGIRLSGGQRQRLGIARALYRECEIMILDEPTAALDQKTESMVLESITKLRGQKTFIIVAHNPTTIAACETIYEVADGQVRLYKG